MKKYIVSLGLLVFIFSGFTPISDTSMAFAAADSISNTCSNLDNSLQNKSWRLLGPADGRVNAIIVLSDGRYLAGTDAGGIFVSSNKGSSWTGFSTGLTSKNILQIKQFNTQIYAATGNGVYKLNNTTWVRILSTPYVFPNNSIIALGFQSFTNTLWALGEEKLYKTTSLDKFVEVTNLPTDRAKSALLVSEKNGVWLGTEGGIYQYQGSSNTWKKFYDKGVYNFVEDETGAIYATVAEVSEGYKISLIKKPFNAGSFTKISNIALPKTGVFLYSNGKLFTEDTFNINYSINKGTSFEVISGDNPSSENTNIGQEDFWDVRNIYPITNDQYLVAHDNGISLLNTITKKHQRLGSIPLYSQINSVIPSFLGANTLYSAFWDHTLSSSKGCDGSWRSVNGAGGGEDSRLFLDPKNDSLGVVRSDIYSEDVYLVELRPDSNSNVSMKTIYASPVFPTDEPDYELADAPSVNAEHTITFDTSGSVSKAYIAYDKDNKGKLLSFNVTNRRSDMQIQKTDLPFSFITNFAYDKQSDSFIAIGNGRIGEGLSLFQGTKGANNTINWQKIISVTQWNPGGLFVSPHIKNEFVVTSNHGVVKFTNNQPKEIQINLQSPLLDKGKNVFAYDDALPNVMYFGAEDGFYYSKDGGITWSLFNDGLINSDIRQIVPLGNKIFIGTWGSGNAVILKSKLLGNVIPPSTLDDSKLLALSFDVQIKDDSTYKRVVQTVGASQVDAGSSKAIQIKDTTIGQFVKIPNAIELNLTKDLTVAFWFYKNKLTSNYEVLLSKANANVRDFSFSYQPGTNKLFFEQRDQTGKQFFQMWSPSLVAGQWYHVAATVKDNAGKLYLNGKLVDQKTRTLVPVSTEDPVVVGYPGFDSKFDGYIDEVYVHTIALAESDIINLSKIIMKLPVVSSANIAQGKPVSASSVQTQPLPPVNVNAANVTDGSITTRWSSEFSDNQSVTVDLGKVYDLDKIILNWEYASGRDYDLQASTDGTSWSTLLQVRNQNLTGPVSHNVQGKGRYVKMQGIKRNTPYGYSLYEMEVYGREDSGAVLGVNLDKTIPYNFGTVVLSKNSTGEAVKELQRFLNENLGIDLIIDGKLGSKTLAIVKQWQRDNNLEPDGFIGSKTKELMNAKASVARVQKI